MTGVASLSLAWWPGEPEYERARGIWNGMIDRRPAVIVPCRNAAEVAAAIRFALAEALPVTVRGGGHNVAGLALADGAVMIDLSPMREVTVDPVRRLAHAGGGALLSDLDATTLQYGLACPAGVVSETGLGGLALGGGYGWLGRRHGLTCDHIEACEVVLADGSVIEAPDDLLWGLRGGGGNFGVVTRFTLRLHPVGPVWQRNAVYPLADAVAALLAYRDAAPNQPDDLQLVGALRFAPQADWIPPALWGEPVMALGAVYLGEAEAGESSCAKLFRDVPPAARRSRVLSFAELQALGDGSEPKGRRYYTSSCYLDDVPEAAAQIMVAAAADNPLPHSVIDLGYLMGAIARVPVEATAFPRRLAPYQASASAAWDDPADDEAGIRWSKGLIRALAPWRHGGSYVNYTQVSAGSAEAVYGSAHYARLARLKAVYDPDNLFRGNHNIVPDSSSITR